MKNVNNRKLIIAFGGLLALFVAIKVFRSPRLERNLPNELVKIDSSVIAKIIIRPAVATDQEILLVRQGKNWKLKSGQQTAKLEQGAANSALRSLMSLHPQAIVSKRKAKWREFEVNDSTGTQVRLLKQGDDEVLNVWLGRTGFNQGAQGGFAGAYTYVRLDKEEEVYTVDGFLASQFNRKFDDWRDKSFLRLKPDSITRIEFMYPADTNFYLEKRNRKWMMAENEADSSAVQGFLSALQYKNVNGFSSEAPASKPDVAVNFFQASGRKITVEGWRAGQGWNLSTGLQPGVFFSGDESAVKDLFKGKRTFERH